MELYAVTTGQSVYVVGHGEGLGWAVLSRVLQPSEHFAVHAESRTYSGELLSGPQVGESMRFFDAVLGDYVNSTPVELIVPITAERASNVLPEFDRTAEGLVRIARRIGFEGVSKTAGADSVEALIGDLRRAIVRAS